MNTIVVPVLGLIISWGFMGYIGYNYGFGVGYKKSMDIESNNYRRTVEDQFSEWHDTIIKTLKSKINDPHLLEEILEEIGEPDDYCPY